MASIVMPSISFNCKAKIVHWDEAYAEDTPCRSIRSSSRGHPEIFEATRDVEVVAEATTGAEALALVRKSEWDVMLLDISLPDLNGLEVLNGPTRTTLLAGTDFQHVFRGRFCRSGL